MLNSRQLTIWLSCVLANAIFAFALVAVPSRANALEQVTCTGSSELTYTPGITNEEQQVTIAGNIEGSPCLSLVHPSIASGFLDGGTGGAVPYSCNLLEQPNSGNGTIVWKNALGGQVGTTTFNYTTLVNPGTGGTQVITASGSATGGLFAGSAIVITVAYAAVEGSCNSPTGLIRRAGPATLNITSLL